MTAPLRHALILCLMLALAPAAARATDEVASIPSRDESVRVLIMDRGFRSTPEDGETLDRVDAREGRLVLGGTSYTGRITVWRGERGLYLVNDVPLEQYVEGVVLAEVGRDWHREALKAQAVAVRTYVLAQRLANLRTEYDVTSSVLHQVYRGQNSDSAVAEAVRATRGEVMAFEGEPIMAYYHSTSGGLTEDPSEVFGNYPYLKSVEASGRLSPYSLWTRRIPLAEVDRAAGVSGTTEIRVVELSKGGRARTVSLIGPYGEREIAATALRQALGWIKLPSTDFSVYVRGAEAVFDGRGFGHGVGMCQWTSLELALDGKTYREILAHFYPGADIRLYSDLQLTSY